MAEEQCSDTLKKAADWLSGITNDVIIKGDGPGGFVVATFGDFGVEFYADDDGFVVDPALGGELQGERFFATAEAALSFASDWLVQKS